MNTVAKLFIGREERELNFVNLDYYRYTRVTGRPQTEVLGGLIQVRFTPKGDEDTILRWMFTDRVEDKNTDPSKSYYTLKDGEVVFYEGDFNGRILFKYKFEDCTPIHYQEFFSNEWGMETEVVLSAAIQRYKTNVPFVKQWNESWRPPTEYKPQPEEDLTPRYKSYYTDLQGNKKAEVTTGEEVYLVIESTNAIGETINIDLSDHTKDFIYNDKVIENDIIKDFNISSNEHKLKLLVIAQQPEPINIQ